MRKVHSSGGEIAFVFDFYRLIQEYFFLSLSSPFYTYGQRQAKIHQSKGSIGNSLQGVFSYVFSKAPVKQECSVGGVLLIL